MLYFLLNMLIFLIFSVTFCFLLCIFILRIICVFNNFKLMISRIPSNEEDNVQPNNYLPKQQNSTREFSPDELGAPIQQQLNQKKRIRVSTKDWKNQADAISHLAFYLNEFLKNPLHSYSWREKRPFKTYSRMSQYMKKSKIQCKAYDCYLKAKHEHDFENLFQFVVSEAQKYREKDTRIQRFLSEVQKRVQSIKRYMEFVNRSIRVNQQLNLLMDDILTQQKGEKLVSNENI